MDLKKLGYSSLATLSLATVITGTTYSAQEIENLNSLAGGIPTMSLNSQQNTEAQLISLNPVTGQTAPVVNAGTIDGSKTKIFDNGSVDVVVEIQGLNLDKLDTTKVKIKTGEQLNNSFAFANETGTALTVTGMVSQDSLMNGDKAVSLVLDNGLASEQTIAVKAAETTTDSRIVGDYETHIIVDDATGAMRIGAGEPTSLSVDTTSIDGSKTTINSDGSVTVETTIQGQGLNQMDASAVKIKAGNDMYNATVKVNDANTVLTATHTFPQTALMSGDKTVSLVLDNGLEAEQTLAIKADATTAASQVIGDYETHILVDGSNLMTIGAKQAVSPVVNNETIDGSKTMINADGSVDVEVEVQGTNLDKLDASRVKITSGEFLNDAQVSVNAAGTVLTASHTFSQEALAKSEETIGLVIDNGLATKQTIEVTADEATEDAQSIGDFKTYVNVDDVTGTMTIGATPASLEINTDSINGSKTKIFGNGSVDVVIEIQGKNLDKLDTTKVKIKTGDTLNTAMAFANADGTTLTVSGMVSQDSLMDGDKAVSLVLDNGLSTEQTLVVKADASTEATLTVGDYETHIIVDDETGAMRIGAGEPTSLSVDTTSIDGSKTTINSDGSVTVETTIQGQGLNQMDASAVKIKAGNDMYNATVKVNDANTVLTATHTFPQTALMSGDKTVSLVLDNGLEAEQTLAVKADATTAASQVIGDYETHILVDGSNLMTIGAKQAVSPVVNNETIDGSKTMINADGSVDVEVEVQGTNLDKLDASRIKIASGEFLNDAQVSVNAAGTVLTATHTFSQEALAKSEETIGLVIDNGLATKQTIEVTADEATEDAQSIGNYQTYINIDDATGIMTIGASTAGLQIDADSINGSKTKIFGNGSVDVVIEIQGKNLDKLDTTKVKIKTGDTVNAGMAFANADGTTLTVSGLIPQASLLGGDKAVSLVLDSGLSTEQTLAVKADAATEATLTVGGYETYITVDNATGLMTIGAK